MSNIKELLAREVPDEDISLINEAKYIKIDRVEELFDELFDSWSTQNFNYYLYKGEGYGNLGVAASIEVVTISGSVQRTFVGACNFPIKAIHPNTHFLATAKSECVKNAASDIGKRLGRGLNEDLVVPHQDKIIEANGGVDMQTNFDNVKLKTNATKIKNK